jgi:AcrR family transcriptional regulator
VVAVAMRVMREEGLEKVTMRRLAGELDTGPASLYVYVENTAELHGAILDELLAELTPPPAEGGAREQLIAALTALTEVLLRHPSLARSVLTLRPSGPHYLRLVDSLLGLLLASGAPAPNAAWGVDILVQHAMATAAEHGGDAYDGEAARQESAIAGTEPGAYPNLDAAGEHLMSGTGAQRSRWAFEAMIAGITATAPPA